ncbi:hypothetical protein PRIPAC_85480 [Pristionchus pacificus]|uniref:Uncharacterized protein n=1 Tax=Pristionchus pacificus TaxID=54126 RepID=A0A2A6BV57_PRIPA|nr:hypothetical protein PRIPAC_85480 [Pristionchus pacificus]|eukprot:PDM69706.1 hypothetical protein PRIPAC_44802 [Pristionchus pacificus]
MCCQPAYINIIDNRLSCNMGIVLAVDSNNFESEFSSLECSPSGIFTFKNASGVERAVAKVTCTL